MTDSVEFPQSICITGVADGDVTPPVGIYHRMWGAARHDRSTGVHRPLRQTTLVLAPADCTNARADCSVFIALDHCLLWTGEMAELLQRIGQIAGIDPERVTVFYSHTHAAGLMGHERESLPGGELIPEYLAWLGEHLGNSVRMAVDRARPAAIVYGTGRCNLATNRDYLDPHTNKYVCGYNPAGETDDTVLVARIDDARGNALATLVNYACHPTTLAWENTLISPDFVGAMRDVVERLTAAPCFFIQGASGDIGPRDGYVGDTAVADRNGRQLGYAALSALEALPATGTRFEYAGAVISGATLGTWKYAPIDEHRRAEIATWQTARSEIPLPYRTDLPQSKELQRERKYWRAEERAALAAGDDSRARDARAMVERMTRRLTRVDHLPQGNSYPYPLKLWRMGDAVWLALDGEHYNLLQRELRKRFPDTPLVVGTLANGSSVWYLPDRNSYGKGLYQEDASVLAAGALETLIDALSAQIEKLKS